MVEYLQNEMTGALLHILCLRDERRGTCQTVAIVPGHVIETLLEAVDLCLKYIVSCFFVILFFMLNTQSSVSNMPCIKLMEKSPL